MSKLMTIAGIIFAAAGIAFGLMVMFSPGPMQVYGLTPEVAVVLLVGGILAIGMGGIIDRLAPVETVAVRRSTAVDSVAGAGVVTAAKAVVADVAATDVEPLSPAVSETIEALERAKTDLRQAFEDREPSRPTAADAMPVPANAVAEEAVAPAEAPAEEATEDTEDEGQLYVVEERTIRGRPARILSDGTVEAETSEGWMRFENLEHLDEYLDAMEPTA